MGIILKPFAMLLLFLYNTFSSYGLALILFAVIVKLILFPVTLQSKKSMIKTTMLSSKMQQLQKQYGKDRERYNIEVQKLYDKEKVNPMSGCLWSLIPMFVLIGLFYIIQDPLTFFMNASEEQMVLMAESLDWQSVAVARGWLSESGLISLQEKLAAGEITSLFQDQGYNQLYLASLINESNVASLQALTGNQDLFAMNFSFLGLDLSAIPTWKFWTGGMQTIGLFILVIISLVSSFVSMKVTMATNKMNKDQANTQADQTSKMMMWMMPLMSLWIGFSVPAGLSVYWICQYLVSMVQEVICGKMLKKDYEAARVAAEKRALEEKEEEKRRKEEARLERARRIEEEKNNKSKKKSSQKKDEEPEQEGINKEDSREGIRAYARGRSYMPDRFGGVTAYVDPTDLVGSTDLQYRKKKREEEREAKAKAEAEAKALAEAQTKDEVKTETETETKSEDKEA